MKKVLCLLMISLAVITVFTVAGDLQIFMNASLERVENENMVVYITGDGKAIGVPDCRYSEISGISWFGHVWVLDGKAGAKDSAKQAKLFRLQEALFM